MTDTKPMTLAEEMKRDDDLLRRRFVHATRPTGPLSLDEAGALCRRMEGDLPWTVLDDMTDSELANEARLAAIRFRRRPDDAHAADLLDRLAIRLGQLAARETSQG